MDEDPTLLPSCPRRESLESESLSSKREGRTLDVPDSSRWSSSSFLISGGRSDDRTLSAVGTVGDGGV